MSLPAFPSDVLTNFSSKAPLTWRIFFTEGIAKEEHIATVGKNLKIHGVLQRSYWVEFNDEAHESQYLPMIKNDASVTAVYPERERQSIFHDEDERSHPKPYTADEAIIHKVRLSRL